MKEIAIVFGLLLTGLGLFGYLNPVQEKAPAAAEQSTDANNDAEVTTEKKTGSKTALIPALFGMPLVICGTLAYLENIRKHAMHAAAGIALLGTLLAGGRGLMKISALFGDDPVSQRAVAMVLTMSVICLIYVGLSVRSFTAVRKAREAEAAISD